MGGEYTALLRDFNYLANQILQSYGAMPFRLKASVLYISTQIRVIRMPISLPWGDTETAYKIKRISFSVMFK
jgi:hypothetical protein